jgi:hypothetical protein
MRSRSDVLSVPVVPRWKTSGRVYRRKHSIPYEPPWSPIVSRDLRQRGHRRCRQPLDPAHRLGNIALRYGPATGRFDQDKANAMIRLKYRKGYEIPDQV